MTPLSWGAIALLGLVSGLLGWMAFRRSQRVSELESELQQLRRMR